MKLITDKMEKSLRRSFHSLCYKLGKSEEEKRSMLASYGCVSCTELAFQELGDLCNKLETELNPRLAQYDKCRKRLIASIFAWLKAVGRHDADIRLVKGIACRAAEKNSFNDIPLEKLRSLYSAFTGKVRDMKSVNAMTIEEVDFQSFLN